ncbi:MAG TPA: hypothetical protein VJH03_09715 [Blastocatellia bacterium]|nr:hypothetical protein [Blastocatellia bacterium]
MKLQRLFIALTVLNLGLTMFLLAEIRRVQAVAPVPGEAASPAQVLRGGALEIVDEQGRVRASIKLHAADPKYKWPNGKIGYPETVMFRLIDGKGRPEVKLGASEQGGGLGLIGETDSTHIVLEADGPDSSLKLRNKEGRQQLIKP